MTVLATARKAIATSLLAFATWVAAAPTDGITGAEWGALVGCFIAGGVIYLVPNEPT